MSDRPWLKLAQQMRGANGANPYARAGEAVHPSADADAADTDAIENRDPYESVQYDASQFDAAQFDTTQYESTEQADELANPEWPSAIEPENIPVSVPPLERSWSSESRVRK